MENKNTDTKNKRKLSEEVILLIKEETLKTINDLRDSLLGEMKTMFFEEVEGVRKKREQNKYIEESVSLFLEHYVSLKEYVEEAKKQEMSEDFLEEAKNSLLTSLMESRVDSYEDNNKFTAVFKNIEKTEIFLKFLTNTFNNYIEDNIQYGDKMTVKGRTNNTSKRKYKTAILLKRYYMEGMELADIGLYNEDVYSTGSSEYQKKFVVDRRILIQNLAPMLFGIEVLDLLRSDK